MLSIPGELLNHLLTTAWSELRQWLVNTLQWMKGLGIKWQDVLKEKQVVVEEGAVKPLQEHNVMHVLVFLPFIFMLTPVALHLPHSSPIAHRHSRFPHILSPHLFAPYLNFLLPHNQRSLLLNGNLRQLTFMRLDIPVQPHSYVQWAERQKPPHTPPSPSPTCNGWLSTVPTLLLPSNESTFCSKEVVLCWNLIWFNVSICNI